MQTFVPFNNFQDCADVLDNRRLNKQLLEGRQIYNILSTNKTSGAWVNHPAVKMWRNHDNALYAYLVDINEECVARGINTEKNWSAITKMHNDNWNRGSGLVMPPWWGDERVHLSHRQNLYAKDAMYYAEFASEFHKSKVSCCDTCNYFWPTHTLFYNSEFPGYITI